MLRLWWMRNEVIDPDVQRSRGGKVLDLLGEAQAEPSEAADEGADREVAPVDV
jgi:hypothetical protein